MSPHPGQAATPKQSHGPEPTEAGDLQHGCRVPVTACPLWVITVKSPRPASPLVATLKPQHFRDALQRPETGPTLMPAKPPLFWKVPPRARPVALDRIKGGPDPRGPLAAEPCTFPPARVTSALLVCLIPWLIFTRISWLDSLLCRTGTWTPGHVPHHSLVPLVTQAIRQGVESQRRDLRRHRQSQGCGGDEEVGPSPKSTTHVTERSVVTHSLRCHALTETQLWFLEASQLSLVSTEGPRDVSTLSPGGSASPAPLGETWDWVQGAPAHWETWDPM